jgi:hypothetical protein
VQIACSFNPASAQLTGGATQTMTVTLAASATASVPRRPSPFFNKDRLALAALFPLAILCGFRRRGFKLLAIVAALGLLLPSISCGSGGGSGGGGGGGGGSNSYTVTVSGSENGASVLILGTVDVTVTH